jgi:hypothetical protein
MKPLIALSLTLTLALPLAAQITDSEQTVKAKAVTVDLKTADLSTMADGQVLARLKYSYGGQKDITVKDAFAMALLIHAETWGGATQEDAEAMIWSMAQRSYWSPTWNAKSLADMIYAYSQPINPIWRRDGKMCKEGGAKHDADACNDTRLAKRDEFIKLKWKDLNETARKAVISWLEGTLNNPVKGAVGWLAKGEWGKGDKHAIYGERKGKRIITGYDVKLFEIKSNVFAGREQTGKDSRGVPFDTTAMDGTEVTVEPVK